MGYPFRGEVQQLENQDHQNIKQLSENPNKVVRDVATPNKKWQGEKVDVYREARDYFYKLRDEYGIAVPDIDFVVGENNDGHKSMFVVVDKIDGKNVAAEKSYSSEVVEDFDTFYSQLLQSFFDAYKNKQPYWSDSSNLQIVYGRKAYNTQNRIYIVDIEPRFFDPTNATTQSWNEAFKFELVAFDCRVSQAKEKFPQGTIFQKTHEKLKEIMEYLGNDA